MLSCAGATPNVERGPFHRGAPAYVSGRSSAIAGTSSTVMSEQDRDRDLAMTTRAKSANF